MRKKEKSLQTQQLTTSPSVRKLRVCWSCLCFTILSKLSQRRSHFHIRGFGTKTAAIWQPADYQTIFRRPLSVILLQHQTEVDSLTDAVTHPAATRRDGTTGCVSTHPRILGCFFIELRPLKCFQVTCESIHTQVCSSSSFHPDFWGQRSTH